MHIRQQKIYLRLASFLYLKVWWKQIWHFISNHKIVLLKNISSRYPSLTIQFIADPPKMIDDTLSVISARSLHNLSCIRLISFCEKLIIPGTMRAQDLLTSHKINLWKLAVMNIHLGVTCKFDIRSPQCISFRVNFAHALSIFAYSSFKKSKKIY